MEIIRIPLNYFFGVNCYLIQTETGYTLIDTGIMKRREQLENALEKAGCKPGDLKLIIITHGHIDHIGNAAYLRDKHGAKIAMRREDAVMAESGGMFANTDGGVMIGIIGVLMKLFGLSNQERFTPDIYLEDNQRLSEYGLDATVIYTPGHSKGSVSILTDEGDLFCGDIYGNDKKPEKTSIIDDKATFESSAELLKTLDAKTIYPGHGKPFSLEELTI